MYEIKEEIDIKEPSLIKSNKGGHHHHHHQKHVNKLASLKESLNSATLTQSNSNLSTSQLKKVKYGKHAADDWEISARDSWWYSTLKNTPSPLKYNFPSFVQEIFKKPNTYRFKSNGRKGDPMPQLPKGQYLLPGAYDYEDLADRVKKMRLSYGFKNQYPLAQKKSKNDNPNVGPGSYDVTQHMSIDMSRENIKHSFFKSKEKRKIFNPKEGPSPGQYELKGSKAVEITSSFVSETNRFNRESDSKNPGPGSYEPINVWIDSKQSRDFSEKGVFFTPSAKLFK